MGSLLILIRIDRALPSFWSSVTSACKQPLAPSVAPNLCQSHLDPQLQRHQCQFHWDQQPAIAPPPNSPFSRPPFVAAVPPVPSFGAHSFSFYSTDHHSNCLHPSPLPFW